MTIKEAIKHLGTYSSTLGSGQTPQEQHEEAKRVAIENLEKTRWIPVTERLPKAGEYVGNVAKYYLVQNEYGDMLVARYTHSECWEQMYHFKPISDEIVAWMPLPEPYKAESEGKE